MLPKEFVVYFFNQALIFIKSQDKLSRKHMKWVEYLEAYTFTIKHKKGVQKKFDDALSRRLLIVQVIKLRRIGIDTFKILYADDEDFSHIYKV